jgi:hypothetical protein
MLRHILKSQSCAPLAIGFYGVNHRPRATESESIFHNHSFQYINNSQNCQAIFNRFRTKIQLQQRPSHIHRYSDTESAVATFAVIFGFVGTPILRHAGVSPNLRGLLEPYHLTLKTLRCFFAHSIPFLTSFGQGIRRFSSSPVFLTYFVNMSMIFSDDDSAHFCQVSSPISK